MAGPEQITAYGAMGVLEAIDYQTGKIRWSHELGEGRRVLVCSQPIQGLTFTGDAHGNFLAWTQAQGKTLWHAGSGAHISSPPITYELDGHQVVLTSSGSVMFAWTLPTINKNTQTVSSKHDRN